MKGTKRVERTCPLESEFNWEEESEEIFHYEGDLDPNPDPN